MECYEKSFSSHEMGWDIQTLPDHPMGHDFLKKRPMRWNGIVPSHAKLCSVYIYLLHLLENILLSLTYNDISMVSVFLRERDPSKQSR
jgi:hypothetical protein